MSDTPPETETRASAFPRKPTAWSSLVRKRISAYQIKTVEDRNILYVTLDGAALGFTTAATAFISVYVVRLGASALWVSLLTALPALIHLALALPMSRILEGQTRLVPIFAKARLVAHLAYLINGILPFFLAADHTAQAVVLLWGASALVTSASNLAFTLIMNRAVSRERRATQMSARWMAMGVSKIIVLSLAGRILNTFPFPLNYQIVFIGSWLSDLFAFYFISRLQIPDQQPVARAAGRHQPFARRLKGVVQEIAQCRSFVVFSAARNMFWLGIEMVAPLIPIYWVRVLQASDLWVSYFTTTVSAATLFAYAFWVRVKRKKGNRSVLLASILGRSLYPLLISLVPSPPMMLFVSAFNGITFAGENLMFFDAFLDTVPKGKEARFVAFNQTISNTIAFVAPPFGALLLNFIEIRSLMVIGSCVAFIGFLIFLLGGVAKERPPETLAEMAS